MLQELKEVEQRGRMEGEVDEKEGKMGGESRSLSGRRWSEVG